MHRNGPRSDLDRIFLCHPTSREKLFTVTDLIKSINYIIYFVTMVGNVPCLRADNTPWSHTTVTQSPIMVKHAVGNQKLWDHDQIVAGTVASIRYTEDCSLYRGSTVSDC